MAQGEDKGSGLRESSLPWELGVTCTINMAFLVFQLLESIFRRSTGNLMTVPDQRSVLRLDNVRVKAQLTHWWREKVK